MAVSGSTLYVGGDFILTSDSDDAPPVFFIARWDGSSWSNVDEWGGVGAPVRTLVVNGTDLYAGLLRSFSASNFSSIMKWDGSSWSSLLLGTNPNSAFGYPAFALAANGTDVFVGGSFSGSVGKNITKWNGGAWSPLYTGINNGVATLVIDGSDLYAGGTFTTAGGLTVNGIAKWNGSAWAALGTGMNGPVYAIIVRGTEVYAGGSFTMAGGVPAMHVAKWDGASWSSLGLGVGWENSGVVIDMEMIGGDLYVGGSFTSAGGSYASCIAKWDGTAWSNLQDGTGGVVYALASRGTDLYVGGAFTRAGSINASCIAKWGGVAWSALGEGFSTAVLSLVASGSDLYAGVGSNRGSIVSKWNGSFWSNLPPVQIFQVNALVVSGTNLYAGGQSYLSPANCIQKWDGNVWSALGSGVSKAIDSSNHFFVGGYGFTIVGTNTSPFLARANLPAPAPDIAVTQAAALTDGTSGVDFGPVVAGGGSAALTFTLSNPGDAELSGLSVNLDGANPGEFVVSTLARSSFIPGESLTFTVTYAPGASVGSSAAVHIVSNVSGSKSSFDIALSGMGVTANQGWQHQYFGVITGAGNAAPGADPNHNGIPNLLEYALGGNPVGAATPPSVLPSATVNAAGNCLQLNFKRWLDRTDITLTVQAADNLAGPWIDLAQSASGSAFSVITPGISISEEAGGNPRAVSISDLYQTIDPAHPRRFMRLKVSQ